jgi:hypothetical protein
MNYMLVRANLQDYDTWKPSFDRHGTVRKSAGSKGGLVFRNADDPNECVILLEVEDMSRAREFAQSDNLREEMQQAGVVGRPDIYFLNEADRPAQ